MGVALQIHDVPEDVREALAEAASRNGQTLHAYLLGLVTREARMIGNTGVATFRVELPDEALPEKIISEGREGGFGIDRGELP